jgi:hypothetical protein
MRVYAGMALAFSIAGCATGPEARPVSAVRVTEVQPASAVRAPEPPAEIVELALRLPDGQRYRVKTEFRLFESPFHPDMGYEVLAEARAEAPDAGALLLHGEFLSSTLTHGDLVNPLGTSTDVTGARVRFELDARNRVTARELNPATNDHAMAAQEVMEGVEHVRMTYPEQPVRVGESWSGGEVRWDTRPLGWVAVVLSPTFTLEGVEERAGRRWARIGWSGNLVVEPFEVMGIAIAARAQIGGTSLIALDDGYAGHHTIDMDVKLTNAQGTGGEQVARVRVVQQVDRL